MPGFTSLALRAAVLAGIVLAAGSSVSFAQQKVGVSSAVNPDANGIPPGGTSRRLVIGQDVLFNERISTGPAGQTQLLFLDESSMTVGPNSDLTIDQFVYDPKSGTGKLAMSATRGLLRYVGGKLSKQDEAVTLKTSTATLAVRGGAFIVNTQPNGTTNAVFVYGKGLTVTSNSGGSQTVTRPGYQTTVTPGSAPTPPAPQPPGQLAQYLQQLDGRSGGNGGASSIPSDTTVIGSGIGQTISGNFANSLQQAQGNTGVTFGTGPTLDPNNNPTTSSNSSIQVQNAAINPVESGASNTSSNSGTSAFQNVQTTSNNPTNGTSGGNTGTTSPPVTTTSITYAGRLRNTNGNGTARGFFDQSAAANSPYSNGTLTFPAGSPSQGIFTGTVPNFGTITFPLMPGSATITGTSSNPTYSSFTGTTFLSADQSFFYANISPTNQPGERLFIHGGTGITPGTASFAKNSTVFDPTGSTRVFAFTLQPDAALQSNIPFVRSQVGGNLPNASVSPLYAVAPSSSQIGDASTTVAARALQASLAVNGTGANQQSAIAVTTGTFATSATGQPQLVGAMRGSSQLSATGTPTRLSSAVSSSIDGNGMSFYGPAQGNAISGFVLDQTQYNASTTTGTVGTAITPSTANELPLNGSATTYGFAQAALPTAVPNGVGTNRTTQALTGSFGGLMYTTAQPNPYAVQGSTLISTDASTNRVQATLAGTAQSASSGVNTLTMQYGGLTGNAGGQQAFIDNSTFAAHESQTNPQQINGQTLVVNGDATQGGRTYLVSSGAAGQPTQLLPSGAAFCQCQYLQWGYWGGDLRTGNATDANISRVDRGHINTWVAGSPTPAGDLNNLITQSATASYTGAAIGSVFNNGASYMAAGGFNANYNFGTQTGQVAITNFDGKNFAASGRAPLSGPNYAFTVNQPGTTGSVNGTFYGPQAAETGGTFGVQTTVGPTYIASGIFSGKR